jgi:preprotein translocase subunit SecA
MVAHRRKLISDASLLSTGNPYIEKADRRENRVDSALLNAWGGVSPYLFARLERKRLGRLVRRAEDKEKQLAMLPDRRLRHIAAELRGRLLLANFNSDEMGLAYALAREVAHRQTGLRHFHVQLLGGAAMMSGALAEMQTGEGKTLTALLPAVVAALKGCCVHIVTVNDREPRNPGRIDCTGAPLARRTHCRPHCEYRKHRRT